MRRRAFTLIELLVVLGIIAILAALLFPVFAAARNAARLDACASNLHQISIGMMQYMADNDERFPIPLSNKAVNAWGGLIQPYLKSSRVFRCPSQSDLVVLGQSIWTDGVFSPNNRYIYGGYGLNVDYLAPAYPDHSNWGVPCYSSGPPGALAAMGDTSRLVMCVGVSLAPGPGSKANSNPLWPIGGGYALAPAPVMNSGEVGAAPVSGWGAGSYLGPYGGFEAPRHGGRGNVLFVDGHLRSMSPQQLAAGTNWNEKIANTDVKITNSDAYLWHPHF